MEHLPRIVSESVEHKNQRYNTVGDYKEFAPGHWHFTISKMNIKSEVALLIHELVEWTLTQIKGIPEEEIARFDIESGLEDPGASPEAPYHEEHMKAERVERLAIKMLDMPWKDHLAAQDSVITTYRKKQETR